MSSSNPPVVIVGAGFSGIASLKTCFENGLDAVCFEKTDNFGGLWRYREDDQFGVPSVQYSTVINTSKEMNAFSDFPPPNEYDNYMHNTFNLAYLESYAKHHDLLRHIRLRHEVLKVEKNHNYDATGQWKVKIKNNVTNEESELVARGVMICSGHHTFPNEPQLPGQSDFQGRVMHTHSFKDARGLEGKRVMVVGIGNSAVDAAVESSYVAKTVYLSTRRGAWIAKRVSTDGIPFDFQLTRLNGFLETYFTRYYLHVVEQQANQVFNHALYNMKPDHRFNHQHPTITDALPVRVISGYIKVKGDVARLTKKGVVFKGEEDKGEVEVDVIVLATGYHIRFPIVGDVLKTDRNQVSLYRRVFPPQLKHPTLAFIGLVQPVGSIFPLSEIQARWFALLLKGERHLPSIQERHKEIEEYQTELRSRYVDSPRHTIQVDYLRYIDDMARQVGCKPNLLKYFFTDNELFWTLLFGPPVSYQFRLTGPKPWSGARNAVMTTMERMAYPLNTRYPSNKGKAGKCLPSFTPNFRPLLYFFALLAVFLFYFC